MVIWISCVVVVLLVVVPSGFDAQQTVVQSVQCGFLDLAFVVDHSGSISDNDEGPKPNWEYILDFMTSIVQGLEIGYDFNRVAIVTFGNTAKIEFDFAHSSNKQDLINAIRNLTNTGGNTNTTGALRLMRQSAFVPERPRAAKVCVLITDGVPSKRYEADGLPAEADMVKNAGIRIIGVGVTTAVNDTLMRMIVSNPTTDYFKVTSFSDLPSLLVSLTNQFCSTSMYTSSTTTTASSSSGSFTPPLSTTGPTSLSSTTTPSSTGTTTTPPTIYYCRLPADVVVLLDASGDMTLDTFRLMRSFVANMAYTFNTSHDFTRLSVVYFADSASTNIYLNTFAGRSEADLATAIRAIKFQGGGTNTAGGLSFALENAFTASAGDRPEVPNILLMLVAGPSNNLQGTLDAASRLKNNFTQVISIGINGDVYETELNSIVSYPYASNRILVNSPGDLSGVLNQTMDMLCNNINECLGSSCQNGGICADSINRYICFCQPPYAGTNCELLCQKPTDVVFALDGSGSIGAAIFLKYIEFLRAVVTGLNDGTRVGVLIFSDSWKILFQLNTFDDKQYIINALYAYYPGGTTNTAGAIQQVREGMFTAANGDRPDVPNILVLVTDGISNDRNATIGQAILTRNAGISIITVGVGVGDQIDPNELEGIASYPTTSNFIPVENENSFMRIVPTLVQALCTNQNVCQSGPCMNGGACTSLIGGFNCSCSSGYTGKFCERRCSAFIDLVFVIDCSGSIRQERFPAVLDFFAKIVDEVELSPTKTRIGAISFADTSHVNFNLNSFVNKGDVINAIKRIKFLGEKTNIASALLMLKDTMFLPANGGRSNAQRVAILFTDGDSNVDADKTIPYAVEARNAQIFIIVVGLGTDVVLTELRSIASRPLNRTVFTTPLASGLQSLLPGVVRGFCNDTNDCSSSPCQNGLCFSNFGRLVQM